VISLIVKEAFNLGLRRLVLFTFLPFAYVLEKPLSLGKLASFSSTFVLTVRCLTWFILHLILNTSEEVIGFQLPEEVIDFLRILSHYNLEA